MTQNSASEQRCHTFMLIIFMYLYLLSETVEKENSNWNLL